MTANLVTVRIGLVHQGLLDVKLGEKKERRGEESGDEESDEGENECLLGGDLSGGRSDDEDVSVNSDEEYGEA